MLSDTMTELLKLLESSDQHDFEVSKQKFHELFNQVKENWLVNGLYDYYLSTNSTRSMEILVNVKEPHYTYLFDKIIESIKGSKHDVKVQALTLLGHIVRKEPAWLYKIAYHQLMKDLLKLLKNENDILILLSALMALIVLLPIIPSLMGSFLQDVFEIFSRFAAWNCSYPVLEEQMVHMQMAVYALFQRLYGMYPCNFLAYLRDQYRNKDLSPIFTHTIKPMLDTVKMHPLLVTTSKTSETTTERWKKMGAHDIVVECERFSLDVPDRCLHEPCFITRSRSSTVNSSTYVDSPYQLQLLRNTQLSIGAVSTTDRDFFSPTIFLHCQTPPVNETTTMPTPIPHSHFQTSVQTTMITSVTHASQESSSPPEAAIEATPETTPIRDVRITNRIHPTSTSVARALTTFNSRTRNVGSGNNTPTHSQPSSPMRKEVSPFNFPPESNKYNSAFGNPKSNRLHKLAQDRSQMSEAAGASETNLRSKTPLVGPTSPLKIISSPEFTVPSSPIPSHQRIDSPLSQEDEEVLAIVGQVNITQHSELRQCDSVLHELEGFRGNDDDVENCEQEHGSPCTAGGLHMPNSKSINNFCKRVRRLRYHSQCAGDMSTGSSPWFSNAPQTLTVRRANSCPEMKKSPVVPTIDNINKTLDETDEDTNAEESKPFTNGIDAAVENKSNRKQQKNEKLTKLATSETQTENFWPMPYEHLFLGIFPSLENNEIKPSPSQSPAPLTASQEKAQSASVYDILDKYIETVVHSSEKDSIKQLKDQLQLLYQQLLFERHRRETHAFRNRRLLVDARNMRELEEHNSALRDQVQLKQKDIDNLKDHLEQLKKEVNANEIKATEKYWETQCINLQKECRTLKAVNEDLQKEMIFLRKQCTELDSKWQASEATLLQATAEVKIAKEQAVAGERGRVELEQVNKEMILLGELLLKYQERLNDLPGLRKTELSKLVESYKHEIKVLNQQLETKNANLEAYRTRVTELDGITQHHDESIATQKRILNDAKEEYHEKLRAVESKYQTQLTTNRFLEEKVLELWQRIEISAKKAIYSPDTSSCHEVNATLTDRTSTATGISPHSSPLSASLASSDGSMAFMIPDVKDVKNLQVIVDQKEPINIIKPSDETVQTTNETINSFLKQQQYPPSTSTKHD